MPSFIAAEDHNALAAARRHEAFQKLRPVCSVLLQQRSSASHLHEGLTALHSLLESIDPIGLSGCTDYVLFPLMLIIDSVAPSRQKQASTGTVASDPAVSPPSTHGEEPGEAAVPAAKSDKVAEAAMSELKPSMHIEICTSDGYMSEQ